MRRLGFSGQRLAVAALLVIGLPDNLETQYLVKAVKVSADRHLDNAMLTQLDVELQNQERYGPLEDGLEENDLAVNQIEEFFTPKQLTEAQKPGSPAAPATSEKVKPSGKVPPRAGLAQLKGLAMNSAKQKAELKTGIHQTVKSIVKDVMKPTSPAEDIRNFVAKKNQAQAPAQPQTKDDKMKALKAKILAQTLAKLKAKNSKGAKPAAVPNKPAALPQLPKPPVKVQAKPLVMPMKPALSQKNLTLPKISLKPPAAQKLKQKLTPPGQKQASALSDTSAPQPDTKQPNLKQASNNANAMMQAAKQKLVKIQKARKSAEVEQKKLEAAQQATDAKLKVQEEEAAKAKEESERKGAELQKQQLELQKAKEVAEKSKLEHSLAQQKALSQAAKLEKDKEDKAKEAFAAKMKEEDANKQADQAPSVQDELKKAQEEWAQASQTAEDEQKAKQEKQKDEAQKPDDQKKAKLVQRIIEHNKANLASKLKQQQGQLNKADQTVVATVSKKPEIEQKQTKNLKQQQPKPSAPEKVEKEDAPAPQPAEPKPSVADVTARILASMKQKANAQKEPQQLKQEKKEQKEPQQPQQPKEEKKEEATEPQQNQLVTHEAQLEQSLDENISKKLEQVEKEENDQAEKAKAEAATEPTTPEENVFKESNKDVEAATNVFSAETNKDDQATDSSEPLKLAGVNIDDLQKQLSQQSVSTLQGNMMDVLGQALGGEDGPTMIVDTSEMKPDPPKEEAPAEEKPKTEDMQEQAPTTTTTPESLVQKTEEKEEELQPPADFMKSEDNDEKAEEQPKDEEKPEESESKEQMIKDIVEDKPKEEKKEEEMQVPADMLPTEESDKDKDEPKESDSENSPSKETYKVELPSSNEEASEPKPVEEQEPVAKPVEQKVQVEEIKPINKPVEQKKKPAPKQMKKAAKKELAKPDEEKPKAEQPPAEVHEDDWQPEKDLASRPIDHLVSMDLHGEEVPKVEQMLGQFHIHDVESANESIEYLQQHIKDAKDEVTTLQQKSVDLDQADENLAKADKLIHDEKQKVRSSLNELIRLNTKDRQEQQARLDMRMKKLREQDENFSQLEEQEIVGQEKVAQKIIELEELQESKADQLEFKKDELRKQGEHLGLAQRKLKKDRTHLKQYLSHVQKEEHRAKQVAKQWVERQKERVSADKDAMLEKYLRSRQDNERELRLAEERHQHRHKMHQVEAMKFDDLDDDSWEEEEEVKPIHHRGHKHQRHHSAAQLSEDDEEDYPEQQLHRLENLKRSISDDEEMLAEEHHERRHSKIPPFSVRAGRLVTREEEESRDFDTSLVQTQQQAFEI